MKVYQLIRDGKVIYSHPDYDYVFEMIKFFKEHSCIMSPISIKQSEVKPKKHLLVKAMGVVGYLFKKVWSFLMMCLVTTFHTSLRFFFMNPKPGLSTKPPSRDITTYEDIYERVVLNRKIPEVPKQDRWLGFN